MHYNKHSATKISLALFFLIISFSDTYSQENRPEIPSILLKKPKGSYFVTAPNGLNLRQESKSGSRKLGTIAFGDKIDLLAPAKSEVIEVDHIKGGMAKLDFDGVTGYAFEGYISQFPPPPANSSAEAYAEKIRNNGKEAIYEERRKDWGGYIQYEESITIRVADWRKHS